MRPLAAVDCERKAQEASERAQDEVPKLLTLLMHRIIITGISYVTWYSNAKKYALARHKTLQWRQVGAIVALPRPQDSCAHNQQGQLKVPHLLIFLKDETPESLSWGGVGSGLPNGKNKGALYPGGSRFSTAGAGLTVAEGMIRAAGPRSVGGASSRNSNKSSPPEINLKRRTAEYERFAFHTDP